MSTRIGKNYRLLIAAESAYNELASGSLVALPDTIDITPVTNTIEVSAKTGTLKKQRYELLEGTTGATVGLSGNFSPSHSIMLDAAMFDTASPRVIQDSQPSAYSYSIYKVYTDDHKFDYVTGCVADSLTINGSSGDVVQYSINFRGNTISRENAPGTVVLVTSSCAPDIDPFLFANVTADVLDSKVTAINNFELSLTNEFQGDPEIYQNSSTKNLEILTGVDSELKFSWNYDKDNDDEVYNHLVSASLSDNTIALVAPTGTFTIATYGKYMEYTVPDPDTGVFVSNTTVKLLSDCDSSISALTITTS